MRQSVLTREPDGQGVLPSQHPLAVLLLTMTAKEKLRERIEALTEKEASEALRLLDLRADPILAAFLDAPPDDEPWTADDEAAAAEGRADLAAGRTAPLEQALHDQP